jgi:hypothetical protein
VRASLTTPSGFLTGKGFSATASKAVNSVVFTPIPNAIVRTATAVKPGLLARMRRP